MHFHLFIFSFFFVLFEADGREGDSVAASRCCLISIDFFRHHSPEIMNNSSLQGKREALVPVIPVKQEQLQCFYGAKVRIHLVKVNKNE